MKDIKKFAYMEPFWQDEKFHKSKTFMNHTLMKTIWAGLRCKGRQV